METWGHSAVEILGVTIPLLLYLMASRHRAKRENAERHKQNQERLDKLVAEREYLQPHDHIESEGTLQAEGIIRKRKPVNGT